MFKKAVVSVVLSVSLFSSLALWAKSDEQPKIVAKLEVTSQLSMSEHNVGGHGFIQQVTEDSTLAFIGPDSMPMPLVPALGVMVFGLMYFVLRSSRNRIK